MEFFFERIPHCLNLGISFKVGIGFGIFEAKLSESADKVHKKQRINSTILIIRSYTYEKQVESLNAQIANLVRNGASITEEPKTPEAEQATQGAPVHNYLGGFGHGIDAYTESGFDVKSLGLEIGKHEK
jgi:ATP-dependent Lon protease